jgi:UPF0755 protein
MNRKLIFLLVLLIPGLYALDFWYQMTHQYAILEHEFEITAETEFIPELIDNVVIGDDFAHFSWKLYLKLLKYDRRLKAGNYQIEGDTVSRHQLIQHILRGPNKKETQQLTFIEGWSNAEYANYLDKQGIRREKVLENALIRHYSSKYLFLEDAPKNESLQGYLFPDTYEFYADATEEEILLRLLDEFERKITPEMIQHIYDTDRTLYDVVNLASIVEKEVRTLASKKTVAGIFYNRLEIGMALQSDATVNYITQSGRARSTYDDLAIDSPYNTYKYPGLPPGPIANPGYDSLIATIYPESHDYVYFLTDNNGGIYFAKTLDGHIKNRNRYLD